MGGLGVSREPPRRQKPLGETGPAWGGAWSIPLPVPCDAGTALVAPAAVPRLSLPSLPSQNTSELEGAGDCHQSSINTLPDVSLVRKALHGAEWEQEANWGVLGCASASAALLHQPPRGDTEPSWSDGFRRRILAGWEQLCANQSRGWVVCPVAVLICESYFYCQKVRKVFL